MAALVLVGIFRPNKEGVPGGGLLAFLSAGAIIYIFGLSAGWWQTVSFFSFLSNPDIQMIVVILLVFSLVIFLITSDNVVSGVDAVKKLFGK